MCPRVVVDRLLGLPIIELEFEKDTLDPHIIIGRECIQLRMKREGPTLCKRCLQFGPPQKQYRGNRDICKDCTEALQECGVYNSRGDFCLQCKETHKAGDKKICGEYIKKATIKNKIRVDKCDAFTAKEILGYSGKIICLSCKKDRKRERQEEKQIHKQITIASQ